MLKAVIFDIDGTLLDSVNQHAKAWQESLEHFGFKFPFDRVRYQIGKGGDKLLSTFLSPAQCKALEKEIEQYRGELFKSRYLGSCKPFPQVKELFEALRARDLKIALGSSAKTDEIEIYKDILRINGLVDQAVSSDDVEASKPDPDVVAIARRKLGNLHTSECCFVGDSPYDAAAAMQDGTKMIGLLCGGFPESDLRSAGATEIFLDPAELLTSWAMTAH